MKRSFISKTFLIGRSIGWSLPWVALACLFFCLLASAESPGDVQKADVPQKKVLVLHTGRKDGPYSAVFERLIQQALNEGAADRVDYYSEYIDDQRFFEQKYREALRDFLRRKYGDQNYDLVITVGGAAINFAVSYGAELFPETPVVFYGGGGRPMPNFTGVVSRLDLRSTIEVALRLQPNTKRVFVIAGASDHDRGYESIARQQLQPLETQVAFTYLSGLPLDELLKEVANLPPDSIIYYLVVTQDGTGARFYFTDAMGKVAAVANAPIYGVTDWHLDHGALGGSVIDMERLARQTSEIALRVLRGEKPENIPVAAPQPNVNMFDWRQLRRWGISEDKLPPGSVVRLKQLTFWEQYKRRIIAAIAFFLIQTVLIIILLVQRTMRMRAEGALRESEARYRQMFEQNRAVKLLIDPASGAIMKANSAASEFYGYNLEALERMKITDINTLQPDQVAIEMLLAATENCPYFVFRHRLASGEIRDVEVHSSPLDVGGRRLLYSIIHDITERRRTEERLRRFFDLPLVGMAITSPDRHFLLVNQKLCDMLGYQEHELTRKTWADVTHPEDIAENARLLDQTLRGETEGYRMDKRYFHYDGHIVYASISSRCVRRDDGSVDYLVLIIEDISERIRAEQSLHQAFTHIEQLKEQLQAENVYLQEEIKLNHNFDEIIGESKELKYVFHKVEQVALADTTVLLLGETGTGKELVARAIHRSSGRVNGPFIKVNCAALPASLIESELFGYEKGAFTGAHARKPGRFELANEGTLLLDEIGELPPELQTKLLRVLQEGEFERLGGSQTIKVNVRIIAATNRNLKMELQNGLFREDLWYRLSVFPITMPPLRQRKDDIPLLVNHFVNVFSKKLEKKLKSVAPGTMKALQDYTWPGNIRELANVIERAVINAQGPVLLLAEKLDHATTLEEPSLNHQSLAEMERDIILRRLEESNWKIEGVGGAAHSLGLKPSTLRLRMTKLGIQRSNGQH